ncbi:MAG: hypothetical protein ACI8RZ_001433 [Myxococcota bacterium]|jgi:hypothetical protein
MPPFGAHHIFQVVPAFFGGSPLLPSAAPADSSCQPLTYSPAEGARACETLGSHVLRHAPQPGGQCRDARSLRFNADRRRAVGLFFGRVSQKSWSRLPMVDIRVEPTCYERTCHSISRLVSPALSDSAARCASTKRAEVICRRFPAGSPRFPVGPPHMHRQCPSA